MPVDTRPSPITLGDFTFLLYEVPENVRFAGPENHNLHKQPGGARIIDVLGRDDDPIAWAGIFLSADAEERALFLDSMRTSGLVYRLNFGQVGQDVVITKLTLVYRKPNFIEYAIECTPVFNGDAGDANGGIVPLQNDLNNAAQPLVLP